MTPSARGRPLAIVAALAVLGLAGGAALRAWRLSHGVGAERLAASDGAFAGSSLSGAAASAWGKLLAALGLRGGKVFTTADLAQLLSGRQDDAVAQAFAKQFLDDPRLADLWSDYLKDGDLDRLARRLNDSRAFTELLNRHATDGRFQSLAAVLARDLEALLASRPSAEAGGPGGGPGARSYGSARETGAVDRSGPQRWRPAVLAYAGAQPAGAVHAGAGPDRFGAPVAATGAAIKDERKESANDRSGPHAHEISTKLKGSVVRAGASRDVVRFIESMFSTMPRAERDALISLCADRGLCDPLAACGTSDRLYAACVSACRATPACSIPFPDAPPEPEPRPACEEAGSAACEEYCDDHRDDATCIQLAAARIAQEIQGACVDARSEACRDICGDNPQHEACLAAADRALVANCRDAPSGSACASGCSNPPTAAREACAAAAQFALKTACQDSFDGDCSTRCEGQWTNPICAAALAAYGAEQCEKEPGSGNCRWVCERAPQAAFCVRPGISNRSDSCWAGPSGVTCPPGTGPDSGPSSVDLCMANPNAPGCKKQCMGNGGTSNCTGGSP